MIAGPCVSLAKSSRSVKSPAPPCLALRGDASLIVSKQSPPLVSRSAVGTIMIYDDTKINGLDP
jgi:xanthosine utilization system XapX-like protein